MIEKFLEESETAVSGIKRNPSNDDSSSEYESDASYIYTSSENGELLECCSDDERDYFGESSFRDDSEVAEAAWIDSDDEDVPECEFTTSAAWMSSSGLRKVVAAPKNRIKFSFSREIFSTRHRIKLFKTFSSLKIAVDTFNLIYIIKDFENIEILKIDRYNITDCIEFSNRILFCSSKSTFLKQLLPDGTVQDVCKRVGKISKMIAGRFLYTIGDQLSCFDDNLTLINSFKDVFLDICLDDNRVLCLKDCGELFSFTPSLQILRRVLHPSRFRFKQIFAAHKHVFISTDTGMCVLNSELEELRFFDNLKSQAVCFAFNDSFIFHGSDYVGSFRILKEGLVYHDKFPHSKVRIPPLSCIAVEKDIVYLAHSRFISRLRLSYIGQSQ